MVVGTHGSTYGGNPLAMAVGIAVWDEIMKPGFLDHVTQMGQLLKQQMAALADTYPDMIEDVRGKGLLCGIKLKEPYVNREIMGLARERGLLSGAAGDNVLRMAPPLIITEEHARKAIATLDEALAAARKKD